MPYKAEIDLRELRGSEIEEGTLIFPLENILASGEVISLQIMLHFILFFAVFFLLKLNIPGMSDGSCAPRLHWDSNIFTEGILSPLNSFLPLEISGKKKRHNEAK